MNQLDEFLLDSPIEVAQAKKIQVKNKPVERFFFRLTNRLNVFFWPVTNY